MVTAIRDRVSVDHVTAAEILGISPSRLRQHVRLGDVVPHFSGSKPLYLISELQRFVEALPTHPEHLPTL
ncbi:helix-turn-helix domain-containing protein [Microbacterium sp. P01]|uniref:helix-turn-helix domain-containing protein n=1 Tax=Microbacterium sp. P01 TaxID=3366261 RepID=UPI003671AF61